MPCFLAGHLDASMATANLENQLHSAQKNLLFLQREHASTLKGLHAEIRRLQQHCTGATPGRGRGGDGGAPCSPMRGTCCHRDHMHGMPPPLLAGHA